VRLWWLRSTRETCGGRYCCGILVTVLLCNVKAMVRVVGVQPTGFWVLWCRFAAEVVVGGRDGSVVEVAKVDGVGFGYVLVEVVVGDGFG
jgi:hypothetical protein